MKGSRRPVVFYAYKFTSKGSNTIHTLLMAPKDKDSMSKSGVMYWFKCPHRDCLEEYTEDSGRTFGDRLKEHLRASSHISQHSQTLGHPVNLECFTIVDRK